MLPRPAIALVFRFWWAPNAASRFESEASFDLQTLQINRLPLDRARCFSLLEPDLIVQATKALDHHTRGAQRI
jgi:hypothetical protein